MARFGNNPFFFFFTLYKFTMSSHYFSEHLYSPNSLNSRPENTTPAANISLPNRRLNSSNRTRSHYDTPTRDLKEDEVPALDIKDIDHEAIRNDPELRRKTHFNAW